LQGVQTFVQGVLTFVQRMVSVCVWHFDFYKLPKSNVMNANILCLVQFGSGRNKLVHLLIQAQNIFRRIVRTLF